jgi:DNA repair protein RadC
MARLACLGLHPLRKLTVAEAARLLQIHLLDHVICGTPQQGRPGFFSFKGAELL